METRLIRALRRLGLISEVPVDPRGQDPENWPAWTDEHVYSRARGAPR
jgi:hypothetical protein